MMHWQVLLCDDRQTVYPLSPGAHQLQLHGDDALTLQLISSAASAPMRLAVESSGLWLCLDAATHRIHVNGRPIQRLAFLRAGDVVHVERSAMLIQSQHLPPPHVVTTARALRCAVLRGLSGAFIGRCVRLDRLCCIGRATRAQIRIADPAIPPLLGQITCGGEGLRLVMIAPRAVCCVNGHRVRAAWLAIGDQIVFADVYRFVVEAPTQTTAVEPTQPPSPPAVATVHALLARWPWLVIAATGLALLLSVLLWFGAY